MAQVLLKGEIISGTKLALRLLTTELPFDKSIGVIDPRLRRKQPDLSYMNADSA